ncbi:MAG TPA: hypothetical protein VG649_21760, partial [Candidatus Angelobacter sp.]|nr:hypothetical protein [Candidatus Angelobacter sp.]
LQQEGVIGKPALKPYRGKLAVRNFRGDDGNVGIIRSPVRAFVLPDRAGKAFRINWASAPANSLSLTNWLLQ